MARMLGRFRWGGCGNFGCRLCGPGDTRLAKRAEERTVRVVIEEYVHPPAFLDDYDVAVVGLLTAQDCPDDAPDGTRWDCRAHRTRPHREDCRTRETSEA